MPRSVALVIDLEPIREFEASFKDLRKKWAAVPRPARSGLARLFWLHPDGDTVVYQQPPAQTGDDTDG
jgi:hypothetical protein